MREEPRRPGMGGQEFSGGGGCSLTQHALRVPGILIPGLDAVLHGLGDLVEVHILHRAVHAAAVVGLSCSGGPHHISHLGQEVGETGKPWVTSTEREKQVLTPTQELSSVEASPASSLDVERRNQAARPPVALGPWDHACGGRFQGLG
jgi:hypothetical protein